MHKRSVLTNPMVSKLELGADLSDEDRRTLLALTATTRQVPARKEMLGENDRPDDLHVVLDGFACRYKLLDDGTRSIMAYLVPGDFCDLHVAILGQMDHSIGTLTPCTIAQISRRAVEELTVHHPTIARALWWATLVDEAILREWLVSMGRRSADRQLAHLLCELLVRLQIVGYAGENGFEFPLTQEELGDTLGISTVHVNRVLQQLREDGLIALQGRMLTIRDVAGLTKLAAFNPNYLHLMKRRPVSLANRAFTSR